MTKETQESRNIWSIFVSFYVKNVQWFWLPKQRAFNQIECWKNITSSTFYDIKDKKSPAKSISCNTNTYTRTLCMHEWKQGTSLLWLIFEIRLSLLAIAMKDSNCLSNSFFYLNFILVFLFYFYATKNKH